MFSRLRTRTNPVFYPDRLRLSLHDDARAERVFTEPRNLDLLTWNIFSSLETHPDSEWLAYRLQPLGGITIAPPIRLSLWSGRHDGPLLQSSPDYLRFIQTRDADLGQTRDADRGTIPSDLAEFAAPIEVPVRVESPQVLLLIDTAWQHAPRGNGGRDRMIELIDAGIDQARRVQKKLAVGVVYDETSATARDLSEHMNTLRDPDRLAAEMPWRSDIAAVILREMSWQKLLVTWEQEREYLDLGGQPVRAFLDYMESLGLR